MALSTIDYILIIFGGLAGLIVLFFLLVAALTQFMSYKTKKLAQGFAETTPE